MRRRDLLATAGTLFSAGCGSLLGGNDQGGPSGRRRNLYQGGPDPVNNSFDNDVNFSDIDINSTDIGSDINVSSVDLNVSNITIDIDSNLDLDDENQGTATPMNNEAAQLVSEATTKFNDAISAYTSFEGQGATLTDVNPTTLDFQPLGVQGAVQEGMDLLDAALETATEGQIANIAALEQVGVFLSNAAQAEYELVQAYDRLQFASERLYAESLLQTENANRELNEHRQAASEAVERLDEETEAEAMQVISTISASLYRQKKQQLEDETESFESMHGGIADLRDGLLELQEGVPQYLGENYRAANNNLLSASASFSTGASAFQFLPGAEALEPKAAEISGVANTLKNATDDLQRSAEAQLNDNRLIFFEARRAAEAHIESNEIVRNMRTLNDIT